MAVLTVCPTCTARYKDLPDELLGRSMRCARCGTTFRVVDLTPAGSDPAETIDTVCPRCGTRYGKIKLRFAGKLVTCSRCGHEFRIVGGAAPGRAETAPAPEARRSGQAADGGPNRADPGQPASPPLSAPDAGGHGLHPAPADHADDRAGSFGLGSRPGPASEPVAGCIGDQGAVPESVAAGRPAGSEFPSRPAGDVPGKEPGPGGGGSSQPPASVGDTAGSLNNRAMAVLSSGDGDQARQLWEEALRMQPYHPETVYNRGLWLWRSGRLTDSALLAELGELRSMREGDWLGDYFLGWVHLERGDRPAALRYLGAAGKTRSGLPETESASLSAAAGRCCSRGLERTFSGHTLRVSAVCFVSDDAFALSAGNDRILRLWALDSGELVRTFDGHTHLIEALCVSRDGRRVASGSHDGTVRLWEIETGQCLHVMETDGKRVTAVALDPGGRFCLVGCHEGTVELRELATGRLVRSFPAHGGKVSGLCFHTDGRSVLSASHDRTVKLWSLTNGSLVRTFAGHQEPVSAVALDSERGWVFTGAHDRTIRLWDMASGRPIRTFEGHGDKVTCLSVARDGRRTLSGAGAFDRSLRLWDTETGRCLFTFEGHEGEVTSVHLGGNGAFGLSGSSDRTVRLWRTHCGAETYPAPFRRSHHDAGDDLRSQRAEFEQDLYLAEQALAAGDAAEAARHVRAARSLGGYRREPAAMKAWTRLYRFLPRRDLVGVWEGPACSGHDQGVSALVLDGTGRRLFSGGGDGAVAIWEAETGACLERLEGHEGAVSAVSLDGSGRLALSAGADRTLRLWDLEKGCCIGTLEGHRDQVNSVSLSHDGRWALSGSADETLILWDLDTGRAVRTLVGHDEWVETVCLSHDARFALSGSEDETVRLWDLITGRCIRVLQGHRRGVTSLSLSYDGRFALSGSMDKTVKLWQVASGRCIQTFEEHRREVACVWLSLNGQHALSAGHDRTVRFWEATTGRRLHEFGGHADPVVAACMSRDGRYVATGDTHGSIRLWIMDWELEERRSGEWDERAQPYVDLFLTLHRACGPQLPVDRIPTEGELAAALTRRGKPVWEEEDFQAFMYTLGCAGFGWLRPDALRSKLETLAAR